MNVFIPQFKLLQLAKIVNILLHIGITSFNSLYHRSKFHKFHIIGTKFYLLINIAILKNKNTLKPSLKNLCVFRNTKRKDCSLCTFVLIVYHTYCSVGVIKYPVKVIEVIELP